MQALQLAVLGCPSGWVITMTFCWYFAREDIEHKTPSREDGMPLATELQYRRDGARFIINASNTLGLYPLVLL